MGKAKTIRPEDRNEGNAEAIEIENVGPIESLTLPINPAGGVVVLRGPNGVGKSTALAAASAILGDKSAERGLSPKDGTPQGSVSFGKVSLTVGKRNRRAGELEASSLVGRVDVSRLVDPGIKDAIAADAARVRTVVSLAADASTVQAFIDGIRDLLAECNYDLTASVNANEALAAAFGSSDPVEIAEASRRFANAAALALEKELEEYEAKAAAILGTAGDVKPVTAEEVQAAEHANTEAIQLLANARAKVKAYEAAARDREQAKERLAELEARELPDVETARETFRNASAHAAELLAKLEALKTEHEIARRDALRLGEMVANAEKVAAIAADLRGVLSSQSSSVPDPSELIEAERIAAEARDDYAKALQAQKAGERIGEAKQLKARAADRKARAAGLRNLATSGIDSLLSSIAVKLLPEIVISSGRMALPTKRGQTFFSDLSTGERWKLALELAVRSCPGGIIPICQEAWEGLDADNRGLIAYLATKHGVTILTAEASDRPGAEGITAAVVKS